MEDVENVGNLEIDNKEGVVRVSLNPKIYHMDLIYSVAHSFTRDNFVLLDGDEEIEIIAELKPKNKEDLEKLGRAFCNRLLDYQIYKQKTKENEAVRNLLLYRALATNSEVTLEEGKGKGTEKDD